MPNHVTDSTQVVGHSQGRVAAWVRWGGPLVLAIALLLHVLVYLHWPTYALQIDTLVYRFGGGRVVDGLDLYSIGRNGASDDLLFTYTPFAALVFSPLALITDQIAQVLSLIFFPALLVFTVWRILKYQSVSAKNGLWGLLALLLGLLVWLEPVRLSIQLGQINLLILAVVVAEMLASDRSRWAGIGIGIVAGIKLTPMIFIVYLLLMRRFRAAALATATLAGTVLVGFAVLPSASRYYWFGRAFENITRITKDPASSTSLRGLFLRLEWPTEIASVLSILIALVSLAVATMAYRRGYLVLGIAIVGMASAAASPFSWSHHWVWFVPLVAHLGYRGYVLGKKLSAALMWVFCLFFADWFTSLSGATPDSSILSLKPAGVLGDLIPSVYVFVLIAVLCSTYLWLRETEAESDARDLSATAPESVGEERPQVPDGSEPASTALS